MAKSAQLWSAGQLPLLRLRSPVPACPFGAALAQAGQATRTDAAAVASLHISCIRIYNDVIQLMRSCFCDRVSHHSCFANSANDNFYPANPNGCRKRSNRSLYKWGQAHARNAPLC